MIEQQGTKWAQIHDFQGLTLRITQPDPSSWRLQSVVDGATDDGGAGQFLAEEFDGGAIDARTPVEVSSDGQGCQIAGVGGDRCVIDSSIRFYNQTGTEMTRIHRLSRSQNAFTVNGHLMDHERLYGTGERFNRINQRGKIVDIWAVDKWCQTEGNSYVPVPLVISSAGYGLFLNRFEASRFDLGSSKKDEWSFVQHDAPLDLYVFAGTPAQIVGRYVDLTGHPPVPADWTFGIHVCRHVREQEFSSVDGIRAMMRKMAEHDLPWHSVIIEGWDAYNKETYDDLQVISDEVHAADRKVLIYQACGRIGHWLSQHDDEFYEAQMGARPEYFVRDSAGNTRHADTDIYNPLDAPQKTTSSYVDITDPAAWEWWRGTVSDPLHKEIGIDGAKIDFCEQFPEITDLVFADGSSPKGKHHAYPVVFNTRMYNYYCDQRPDGGMCFSRGGGIGAQRYPMMWAGDQKREWTSLKAILNASLSAGLCGIPFMCHDLAGYIPASDPEASVEADVFVRGTQLACFSPNMQTHGKVTRPYDFDEQTISIYRLYSNIHCLLIPYLVEQAGIARENGLPLMRHLVLEFPHDERVYDVEDQYLLGDSLLVAPILDESDNRPVYIPEGTWDPLFSGESVTGPLRMSTCRASRNQIPVFVRQTLRPLLADIIEKIQSAAAEL